MLDQRAIHKSAEFVSPGFRAEIVQNSPGICPAYPDFRPESARNQANHFQQSHKQNFFCKEGRKNVRKEWICLFLL